MYEWRLKLKTFYLNIKSKIQNDGFHPIHVFWLIMTCDDDYEEWGDKKQSSTPYLVKQRWNSVVEISNLWNKLKTKYFSMYYFKKIS